MVPMFAPDSGVLFSTQQLVQMFARVLLMGVLFSTQWLVQMFAQVLLMGVSLSTQQ
jgi:hypothetical protein